MILIGALMQVKMSTRGTFEIATAMIMPVVQATMAVTCCVRPTRRTG